MDFCLPEHFKILVSFVQRWKPVFFKFPEKSSFNKFLLVWSVAFDYVVTFLKNIIHSENVKYFNTVSSRYLYKLILWFVEVLQYHGVFLEQIVRLFLF